MSALLLLCRRCLIATWQTHTSAFGRCNQCACLALSGICGAQTEGQTQNTHGIVMYRDVHASSAAENYKCTYWEKLSVCSNMPARQPEPETHAALSHYSGRWVGLDIL